MYISVSTKISALQLQESEYIFLSIKPENMREQCSVYINRKQYTNKHPGRLL